MEDDRHTVVDRSHQLVRVGRDDGVALEPLPVRRVLPSLPQSREKRDTRPIETYGLALNTILHLP